MKEERVVLQSELAASSTLRKEKGTTMSKLVKVTAPLRSTYNVAIKTWSEKHELGVEGDLRGKV